MIFGGESEPALRRVAEYGDGWYGFNLDPSSAREELAGLGRLPADSGCSPAEIEVIRWPYTRRSDDDDLQRYQDLGVSEIVLLAIVAADPTAAVERSERFAREWLEPAARCR